MENYKFLGTRKPTADEKSKSAEIVFIYEDTNGNEITIKACKVYESWEQWGAPLKVLSENVKRVETWRKTKR
jgi:hypothetical protein